MSLVVSFTIQDDYPCYDGLVRHLSSKNSLLERQYNLNEPGNRLDEGLPADAYGDWQVQILVQLQQTVI